MYFSAIIFQKIHKYQRRPSDITVDAPSKQKLPPKDQSYSDSDSLDDAVIRGKIEEANQLIERVKKALEKMKFGKPPKPSGDVNREVQGSHTSSTDIEETIKNLTKETEKLMTGDNELMLEPDLKKPKTRRCCGESTEKAPEYPPEPSAKSKRKQTKRDSGTSSSSNSSLNKTFVKKSKERLSTGSCGDESNQETVPKSRPSFSRDLENARIKSAELMPDCCRTVDKLDLERPMTRRNEAEEELPEELILDKFRNCPEDGQLAVNSSLEELQAKLQTISESTESSLSTPRNRKSGDPGQTLPKDYKSSCCNTDVPNVAVKETQVEPEKKDIGIVYQCPRENKCIQTAPNPKRILKTCNTGTDFLIAPPRQLVVTNLTMVEIQPQKVKCDKCKEETLPIVEVAPSQKKIVCDKCKKDLKEEHLKGVCIPSKLNKLQKLTIKLLPPISIDQKMAVKQVLNFFITPQGETRNLLEETENATFIVLKRSSNNSCSNLNEQEKNKPKNGLPNEQAEENEIRLYDLTNQHVPESHSSVATSNSSRNPSSKNSKFFLKIRDVACKNLDLADEIAHDSGNIITCDLDEETQKKLLVYKSYNIYDNPNRHDPGDLDEESVDKLSGIDMNFYKTFINPSGRVYENEMPFRSRVNLARDLGFESKEVQCDSETLILKTPPETLICEIDSITADNYHRPSSSKKLLFKLEETTSPLNQQEADKQRPSDKEPFVEDQAAVVKLQALDAEPEATCSVPPALATPSRSSQETELSTPSEITVTISYSQSSEEGPCQDNNNIFGQEEIEINSIELETKKESVEKNSTDLGSSKRESTDSEKRIESIDSEKKEDPEKLKATRTSLESGRLDVSKRKRRKKARANLDVNRVVWRYLNSRTKKNDSLDFLEQEHKVLNVVNKEVIQKLQEKLKTVDPNASNPGLTVKREAVSHETVHCFIKGLTRISTTDQMDNEGANATSEDNENTNYQNVNYHFIDTSLDPEINLYSKHLTLAKNGRYKDEENLFTQHPHPKPAFQRRRSSSPKTTNENKDKDVQNGKQEAYPKHTLNRYSPETTNSDTVTSNSLSEGEIRCKHTVSNGEIHVCRHGNPVNPRLRRHISPRSNLTSPSISPNYNMQSQRQILPRSNLTHSSISPNRYLSGQRNILTHNNFMRASNSSNRHMSRLRKFDFTDPNLTIEKRRNYFNNWVTYYVKPQEINGSSTSSCSQNK